MTDPAFTADPSLLALAMEALGARAAPEGHKLPTEVPEAPWEAERVLTVMADLLLHQAMDLGHDAAFAHMDPPTPAISWITSLWSASRNQNLLHPVTAPAGRDLEAQVVAWLAPHFGMDGGHMTPGSTLANITALWAARKLRGIRRVVASAASHVSIPKAADILGLSFEPIACDREGKIDGQALPQDLSDAALVLTAGHTSSGAIDDLSLAGRAAWTHVDAAWAGPLRLTTPWAGRLDGVEQADSVSVSAHKWLFQPKESALVFFKDTEGAHGALSFGGAYLARPNIGLLGSHGVTAAANLAATLLTFGKRGLERRIGEALEKAEKFAAAVQHNPDLELLCQPMTGVVVWRPRDPDQFDAIAGQLPLGTASQTLIEGDRWFRNVAANPNLRIEPLCDLVAGLSL